MQADSGPVLFLYLNDIAYLRLHWSTVRVRHVIAMGAAMKDQSRMICSRVFRVMLADLKVEGGERADATREGDNAALHAVVCDH